jgi:hypothetical protein
MKGRDTMKLDRDTLDRMRDAIAPLDTAERRQAYLSGEFPRADAVKDLDVRYRWDLFYVAGGFRLLPDDRSDINSDHIDTGLRRVVPVLSGEG